MTRNEFSTIVFALCKLYNGSVSSTHRTIDHNRRVGGAVDSQHLGWKAADIVLDDWNRKEALIITAKAMGIFVLDEVDKSNHIHIDDRWDAQL